MDRAKMMMVAFLTSAALDNLTRTKTVFPWPPWHHPLQYAISICQKIWATKEDFRLKEKRWKEKTENFERWRRVQSRI